MPVQSGVGHAGVCQSVVIDDRRRGAQGKGKNPCLAVQCARANFFRIPLVLNAQSVAKDHIRAVLL